MNIKMIMSIVSGGVLIVSFQNCAKTSFSSANDGSVLQSLSANGSGSSTGTGDATGNLTQTGTVCTETDDHDKSHASASCSHMENDCDKDASTELVACILVKNGKSLKLGLSGGALTGVLAVSDSVCISKAECLGDVAKAFNVLGAYDRGYCGNNPNVPSLTDAQVKTYLGL